MRLYCALQKRGHLSTQVPPSALRPDTLLTSRVAGQRFSRMCPNESRLPGKAAPGTLVVKGSSRNVTVCQSRKTELVLDTKAGVR